MQKIEISAKTIIFTVFFLLLLRVVWLTRELIYALFLAFIFMSALKPLVNKLEGIKVPRIIASLFVFIGTLVLLLFSFSVLLPSIIIEGMSFIKTLPLFILDAFPFLSKYFSTDSVLRIIPDLTGNFVRVASGVFSNLVFIISVIFFTFYFLLEEKFLGSFLHRFLQKKEADVVMDIALQAENRMSLWLWGQLTLMTIIGVMTYIGLTILGVPFALPLAFLAGLLEIIPLLGPTIALIPALLVASSSSLLLGGAVIILYIIIQQLENNLIVPLVMRKAVGIHPIMTLIALTIGGKLGGLFGILLAVPIALLIETIAMVLLNRDKK